MAWLAESCASTGQAGKVVCFVDDEQSNVGKTLHNIPIMSLEQVVDSYPTASIVSGIGAPRVRELTMNKAQNAGLGFANLIHPRVERSSWIEFGEGAVVCAGSILTVDIVLGRHVQINLDCTIGHDAVLDDFVTLAPGVHISGFVHLGKRVYVGTGAVIINGNPNKPLVVGDDAIIGAGACVTKSVDPGVTVVGVPARPLVRS